MPILIGKGTPPREAFERLLVHRKSINALDEAPALQARLDADLLAAIKQKKPRAKPKSARSWKRYLTREEHDAICGPYSERADAIIKAARAEKQWANKELYRLAEQIEVRSGDREFTLETHWSSTYSTQTDSHGYAQRRAEIAAMKPKALGIDTEVRRRDISHGKTAVMGERFTVSDYDVVVRVKTELDAEVLRYKPGLTTREFVRISWKLGSNPRVYFPGLDPEFESKAGLDYFGREKQS